MRMSSSWLGMLLALGVHLLADARTVTSDGDVTTTAIGDATASVDATAAASWWPRFDVRGSYDAVTCEGTPFWWPVDKKMYIMECLCTGPLDRPPIAPGVPSGHWNHAELWKPEVYLGHSYIRIRELATGNIVANISHSAGFGFGAAFVDYDHGRLWISATANDRVSKPPNQKQRPFGPPVDHSCLAPSGKPSHWECNGVWLFETTDLKTFRRSQTDVQWNGPNTDIGRVYPSKKFPTPSNLPPHKYVLITENSNTMAFNNNADGNLTHGWVTRNFTAKNGAHPEGCPSIRYLPSDGYYYVISGGNRIPLQRSRDLVTWETASGASTPFIIASASDTKTASGVMSSAHSNLVHGHAYEHSFENRSEWDKDANDADMCCESWGGASPEKGGPTGSFVLWGCDGQDASGWHKGPEGFACIGTSNVTLEVLLQSYF
jgi:hypothetical protein